jgi:hypothetical protein
MKGEQMGDEMEEPRDGDDTGGDVVHAWLYGAWHDDGAIRGTTTRRSHIGVGSLTRILRFLSQLEGEVCLSRSQ